jgi:hypothetical protein
MSHVAIASAFTPDKVAPIVGQRSLIETDAPPLVDDLTPRRVPAIVIREQIEGE